MVTSTPASDWILSICSSESSQIIRPLKKKIDISLYALYSIKLYETQNVWIQISFDCEGYLLKHGSSCHCTPSWYLLLWTMRQASSYHSCRPSTVIPVSSWSMVMSINLKLPTSGLTLTLSRAPALSPSKLSGCLCPPWPVPLQNVCLLGVLVAGILWKNWFKIRCKSRILNQSPLVPISPEPAVDIDWLEAG